MAAQDPSDPGSRIIKADFLLLDHHALSSQLGSSVSTLQRTAYERQTRSFVVGESSVKQGAEIIN